MDILKPLKWLFKTASESFHAPLQNGTPKPDPALRTVNWDKVPEKTPAVNISYGELRR